MAFLKLFRSLVPRARIPMRFRPPDAAVALTRTRTRDHQISRASRCPLSGVKQTLKIVIALANVRLSVYGERRGPSKKKRRLAVQTVASLSISKL